MINHEWKKHGIIFSPKLQTNSTINCSEALVPTPFYFGSRKAIRVYYTARDSKGRGHVYWVEFSSTNPEKLLDYSASPILEPGNPGFFDDNGVMATSIVKIKPDVFYLYYVGFERLTTIRYRLLTGLAISKDNGNSFQRFSTQPILERSPEEPFFRGGPFVKYENKKFKMWYVAGGEWLMQNEKTSPKYSLYYVESTDGINWSENKRLILNPSQEGYAIGRPWVVNEGDNWRIFYSERKLKYMKYRLETILMNPISGQNIESNTKFKLEAGPAEFDSLEICYSAVLQLQNKYLMYYNGNNLGEQGMALASMQIND